MVERDPMRYTVQQPPISIMLGMDLKLLLISWAMSQSVPPPIM